MEFTVSERATLASHLHHSLTPVFEDDDDGVAEALRRDAEMDSDPDASLTLEELKSAVGR